MYPTINSFQTTLAPLAKTEPILQLLDRDFADTFEFQSDISHADTKTFTDQNIVVEFVWLGW
jgi:hypothetical protein